MESSGPRDRLERGAPPAVFVPALARGGQFGAGGQHARAPIAGTLEVDAPPGLFPREKYVEFCKSRQTIADTWAIPLILLKAGK